MSPINGVRLAVALMACACGRADQSSLARRADSSTVETTQTAGPLTVADSISNCESKSEPMMISLEKVGPFRTGAPLADLSRRCPLPVRHVYTYGGIQGPSYPFQFPGARIVAVQFNCPVNDDCPNKPPTYWEAFGDSVRLPDGNVVPKTVGEMRERYGATLAISGDYEDGGGNELYVCRFAHIFFALHGPAPKTLTTTPTLVERVGIPDSARVGEVRIWTPPEDTTDPFCPHHPAT